MGKVTIIAELGSSPAPDWDFPPWCATAANCGADAVKVQLFMAEHFPADEQASKKPLEFPRARLSNFVATAHSYGLQAGASVFDVWAVNAAADCCDFLKLAAREQYNFPLMEAAAKTGRRVYRSVDSLNNAVAAFTQLYAIQQYPASTLTACLRLAQWAQAMNGQPWGWSSHTTGYLDCWLAARLGASVIEKHLALTLRDLEAGHSLQPAMFAAMCRAIKGA